MPEVKTTLTINDITKEIISLTALYLENGYAENVREINNGGCYGFAEDLVESLEIRFGKDAVAQAEVEYKEYSDYYGGIETTNPAKDNDLMHIKALEMFDTPLPNDVTIEQANNAISMGGGGHAFISAKIDGKVYFFDSINTQGVNSIFDLTITRFYIASYNNDLNEADRLNFKMATAA